MVKCEKIKIEQQTPISGNNNENNSDNNNNSRKKYKGVRMRSWGSWVSEIRAPNQKTRIWLGSYSTADAAARAYDAALLCLKGSNASLNFPNSSRLYQNDIPQDVVLSPKSIQRVAAAAAATANGTFAGTDNSTIGSVAVTIPDNFSFSSSSSSSSMVSSPSDCYHVEEFDDHQQQPTAVMEALYSFDAGLDQCSPTMMTMMMSSSCFYDPQMMDDPYEDSGDDIRLWSFC